MSATAATSALAINAVAVLIANAVQISLISAGDNERKLLLLMQTPDHHQHQWPTRVALILIGVLIAYTLLLLLPGHLLRLRLSRATPFCFYHSICFCRTVPGNSAIVWSAAEVAVHFRSKGVLSVSVVETERLAAEAATAATAAGRVDGSD